MYTNFKGKVIKTTKVSNSLCMLEIRLIEPTEINFNAGQFLSIEIPSFGLRSYSISSKDTQKNIIEITYDPRDQSLGGAGVKYLNSLGIDDLINFRGPFGVFTLVNTKALEFDGQIIWAATGSGISPIKSMIESYNLLRSNKNILYFGIRESGDIAYKDFFEYIKTINSNFEYHFCLSKDSSWNGKQGYITKYILDESMDIDRSHIKLFICGKTTTVQNIYNTLLLNKFDTSNLHFENFG